MYRIVVAEDNVRIGRHIEKVIKRALGSEISIEVATDGEKALRLIQKQKIDVLYTDIRMPLIGGIALITEAKALYPDMKAVIISAYSDFEVAQAAITLKVDRYLLKPFEDEQVTRLAQSLYHECVEEDLAQMQRVLMNLVFRNRMPEKEDIDIALYQLMLIRFGAFGNKGYQNIESEIRNAIVNKSKNSEYVICKINHDTWVIIFYTKQLTEKLRVNGIALHLLNEFSKACRMVNIYVTGEYRNIKKLYEKCMESYQELSCLLVMGKSRVWEEKEREHGNDTVKLEKKLAGLKHQVEQQMKAKSREGLLSCLQDFFADTEVVEYPAMFLKRITVGVVEKIIEISGDVLTGNVLEIVDEKLSGCYCMKDIVNAIMEIYKQIMTDTEQAENTSADLSNRILTYIKEHIYENVSLGDLTEHFHFSKSYIVRVVNQQTGITPIKWSMIYKIEEAKKMFTINPDLKIGYVSEQLGFMDQRYFCKVFKNYEHMTVSEFREICRKQWKRNGKTGYST